MNVPQTDAELTQARDGALQTFIYSLHSTLVETTTSLNILLNQHS